MNKLLFCSGQIWCLLKVSLKGGHHIVCKHCERPFLHLVISNGQLYV